MHTKHFQVCQSEYVEYALRCLKAVANGAPSAWCRNKTDTSCADKTLNPRCLTRSTTRFAVFFWSIWQQNPDSRIVLSEVCSRTTNMFKHEKAQAGLTRCEYPRNVACIFFVACDHTTQIWAPGNLLKVHKSFSDKLKCDHKQTTYDYRVLNFGNRCLSIALLFVKMCKFSVL